MDLFGVSFFCNGLLVVVLGLAILLPCSALSVDATSPCSWSYLELRKDLGCERIRLGAKFELALFVLATSLVVSNHKHEMLCPQHCPFGRWTLFQIFSSS